MYVYVYIYIVHTYTYLILFAFFCKGPSSIPSCDKSLFVRMWQGRMRRYIQICKASQTALSSKHFPCATERPKKHWSSPIECA